MQSHLTLQYKKREEIHLNEKSGFLQSRGIQALSRSYNRLCTLHFCKKKDRSHKRETFFILLDKKESIFMS